MHMQCLHVPCFVPVPLSIDTLPLSFTTLELPKTSRTPIANLWGASAKTAFSAWLRGEVPSFSTSVQPRLQSYVQTVFIVCYKGSDLLPVLMKVDKLALLAARVILEKQREIFPMFAS